MATKAKAAKGTTLKRGDGVTPTEAFTAIAEITNFGELNPTVTEIDATSHDSDAVEVLMGMEDNGTYQIDFNWIGDNAQQLGLESDRAAKTLRNFELELNDMPSGGTTKTKRAFAAYVTSLSITPGGVNDKITGRATLRVSGAITKTNAA